MFSFLVCVLLIGGLLSYVTTMMPQPRRYCIFCDGAKLTKEHVWTDWTADYIRKNIRRHGTMKTVIDDLGSNPKTTSDVKPIAGDPRSRKVRCVCVDCNTGWMSRAQTAVKPIAIPLITGKPTILDRSAQRVLLMWVAMAVMASEFSDRDAAGVPQSDRKWFYNFQSMPPNWRVYIGWYPRGLEEPFWIHESGVILDEYIPADTSRDGHAFNTQATTYCIGQLYVHVFSSVREDIVGAWMIGYKAVHWLRQIFPIAEDRIDWPPEPPMSDNDAYMPVGTVLQLSNALNERWGPTAPGA